MSRMVRSLGLVVVVVSVVPASAQQQVNWQAYVASQPATAAAQPEATPDYGYGQAAGNGCVDPACTVGCDLPTCSTPSAIWNVSTGALFLTREPQDSYTFSFDSANEANQYVDAADADMDIGFGMETVIGRYDCCCRSGWQLGYWQLFPGSESTAAFGADLAPGFLDGIRNYDQVDYSGGGAGDGVSAVDNVNAAEVHQLTRDWRVYNIEASRVFAFSDPCCSSPWQAYGIAGFRFARFDEALLFISDPSETIIDNDPDEYRIDVSTKNRLYGFQLGGAGERRLTNRLSMRLSAKAGLFANSTTISYFEGGTAGPAVINNGPNIGRALYVNEDETNLAMLGELGLGLNYRVGCNWRLGAEYRVLAINQVALPTDQIYHDTRGIQDVQQIDRDGSVLLHGGVVRIERCF